MSWNSSMTIGVMGENMKPEFNLLTEPWIKVRRVDGLEDEVGIYQFFAELNDYVDLNGESATQDFAVFRLIQAIIIRSFRESREFVGITRPGAGADPHFAAWMALRALDLEHFTTPYLRGLEERFDLFHPETPFYQVASLHTEKADYKGASELVPDVGSSRLFSTATEATANYLPTATAARWLVRLHAYDHSGIKSGAVGDSRVSGGKGYGIGTGWLGATGAIQVCGSSLKDTLLLNISIPQLLAGDREVGSDLAPWERRPDGAQPRSVEDVIPNGIVDLLTWQQRRVRLFPDADGKSVTRVLISNGDRIQTRNQRVDPNTGYRYSKAQSKTGVDVYFPRKHDSELTVWRGVQGLFQRSNASKEDGIKAAILREMEEEKWLSDLIDRNYGPESVSLRLIGAEYGTQDAILIGELVDEIPVRVRLLGNEGGPQRRLAVEAVENVMSLRGSMRYFYKQLRVCAGDSAEDEPTVQIQSWLHRLEREFVHWVSTLDPSQDPEVADRTWRSILWRVTSKEIEDAVEQAGSRAAVGWIETTETGKSILHSSAQCESWALWKLRTITGAKAVKAVSEKGNEELDNEEKGALL